MKVFAALACFFKLIARVTRHEKNFYIGPKNAEPVGELGPTHMGHDNVGQDKIHMLIGPAAEINRMGLVHSFDHAVTFAAQHLAHEASDVGFILDQ